MTAIDTSPAPVRSSGSASTSTGQVDTPSGLETPSRRVDYFDYLRAFGVLGVVLIHAANQVYSSSKSGGVHALGHFAVASSGQALGRFAVGCYFMISGALLLDPARRFRLGHHVARVGVPLLVWSGVYLAVDSWWDAHGLPTTSAGGDHTGTVLSAVDALLAGAVAYHLWFVYALLACYLALPLLRPMTALEPARAKRLLEYALAVWAVAFVIIPTVNHYSPGAITLYPDGIPMLPSRYLGFVLLGYYLHRFDVRIRGWRPGRGALTAVAVASLVAIVALNLWDKITGSTSTWAQTYLTPQVVLLSASVFLLAKRTLNRRGRGFGLVALVSQLSFRMYLVHLLIMFLLESISPFDSLYRSEPALSILLVCSITVTASFAVAYGLERVTLLRRWV